VSEVDGVRANEASKLPAELTGVVEPDGKGESAPPARHLCQQLRRPHLLRTRRHSRKRKSRLPDTPDGRDARVHAERARPARFGTLQRFGPSGLKVRSISIRTRASDGAIGGWGGRWSASWSVGQTSKAPPAASCSKRRTASAHPRKLPIDMLRLTHACSRIRQDRAWVNAGIQ